MKSLSPVTLLLCLLLVLLQPLKGQTLQPNYGAPATAVSVCDGNVTFKLKIIGSSSPCAQGVVTIALPAGYVYAAGSAAVTAGSGTAAETATSAGTATLSVLNIPASPDSTVISYQAFANCSAIGTATSTNSQVYYTLNSPCLGSYMVTSNTFNTQSAALSITNISNGGYNGAVGDAYNRAVTITNNGLGTISQITLKDTSGNGFFISGQSVTAGWAITASKLAYGTDTVSTYLLTGPRLLQGQSIVVTQNIRLVNKCYLQTRYNAYFGCNGNACTGNSVNATATAGATVNSSLTPNLKVIPLTTALICRGQQYAQTVKLANTGTAPLYDLSFNLFSSTWSAVAATQYFNAARNALGGGQSAYANFTYKKGFNGTYAPLVLDSVKSFSSPGVNIAGMPSSVYAVLPVLNPGDTIFITYNELNSLLPGVNSGNTMEVSGGLLRYTYRDGCGAVAAPVATFVRNYQQTRINTLSTVPSNMQQAQTYQALYNFSESNSGVYIYTGATGSTLRFSMTLPANISFSGLATDVRLTNASTGAVIATASSFSYNAAANSINVIYPVTASFSINAMLNGNFKVGGLTLNCAALSNGNNIVLNCYLKASSTCSNEEWMFSQSDKVNFVCPAACGIAGGMNFTGFSSLRRNYGLPDNDNNGVADAAGVLDFTKIKTNYAMLGDTVQAVFSGKINAGVPATGFRYGYAVDTFSGFNTSITSLSASIELYAAGNSTTPFYTCSNLPVSGGTAATRKVDFSIPTLNAIAACPLPGGYTQYNDGDSVVIKINYRISSNIGGQLGVVNMANKFYISTIANPAAAQQYTCGGNYSGNFTIVGNGAGSGTGNLTYSITGTNVAATQGSNVGYMGPCCTTAGSKPFLYEYRSVTIYDSMSYKVPAGYDFVSASISYSYTTGPGTTATKAVAITPVNAAANPLVFNIASLFQSGTLPYGDQGSSMTATVNIRPNCAAPLKSTANFYIRQVAAPGSSSGLAAYASTFADTVYLTPSVIAASAANPTVTTNTGTTSWEVQVSNASVAAAASVWIGKDTGASGVTITSVQKLSGAGGTVVSTVVPVAGVFQLGIFGQTSNYYRINATYTSCVKDSINLAYWYDCNGSGYPASVATALFKKSLQLKVIPQQAALQVNIAAEPSAADIHNFCDTLEYEVDILNAGPGSVSNMTLQVAIPAAGSMSYTPGSFQLQYPAVSGSWVSIADVNVIITGSTLRFVIPAASLAQLDANQRCRIKFGLQPGCGFASGQSVWLTPFGNIACGQTSGGITQQSQKIQLAGAPATTNLYGITSRADTAAQACVAANGIAATYYFKIVNQGPLPTSNSDWFTIQLPAAWQLDTSSIIYSHNPSGGSYGSFSGSLYNFSTGAGLAVGDSLVMKATLFVPAPAAAGIPAGFSLPIIENAIVRFVGYCSSTKTSCPEGQVIVSTNQTTAIPVAHPQYTTGGFSMQRYSSRDTSIAGTITLLHNDTLYAPQPVILRIYRDNNGSNTLDAADSLLGQENFSLAASPVQEFRFNMNSPYTGSFCPSVIAVADFGCYSVTHLLNCSTATGFYSNAGGIHHIQHCDTAAFTLAAADAAGKWVLDSGTAVIADRYLPATAVTIPAGGAARLLWYAYVPGNSGTQSVYPDTVRLVNNARPVITGLSDQTVCEGDSVTFSAAVSVINASPLYTWTQNNTPVAGAHSLLLNVSNAVLPSAAGWYKITATGNNGCAGTDSALLIVHPGAVAGVLQANKLSICTGSSAALSISNPVNGTSYYIFTDSTLATAAGVLTAAGNTLVVTPTVTTVYYVQAVVDASGCRQQTPVAALTITVNTLPSVLVTAPAAVCQPGSVDLTAAAVTAGSTAGLTYTYYTDAAMLSALPNPGAVAAGGTYYIKGTTAAGCAAAAPVTVVVNTRPALVITSPSPVCEPATADITAAAVTAGSTAGLTYTYFTDAATTNQPANPNALNTSGTYYIKGSTVAGCYDIKPVTVLINPLPAVAITNPPAECAPAAVNITSAAVTNGSDNGLVFSYYSNPGATTVLANPNALNTSGIYYIKGASSMGCYTVKPVTVTINAQPSVVITHPPVLACLPVPATTDLTAAAITAGSTAGLTFSYYTNAAGTVPLVNPQAVAVSGTYYIKGTNAVTGCASSPAPVTVTINPKPAITVTASATRICQGSPVLLSAVSAGNSIAWLGQQAGSSIAVSPSATAVYSAVATAAGGCTDTARIKIDVLQFNLSLAANPNPVVAGTSTTFTTTGNYSYSVLSWWPNAFFSNQFASSQTITVKDSSKQFSVIARSADGCLDTAAISITVEPNLKDFFVPNAFTPNNDGQNDVFRVYGSSIRELQLMVFNQWGQKLFETRDPEKGWNGMFNGSMQPAGAYIYTLRAVFYGGNGEVYSKKGTVNLIR